MRKLGFDLILLGAPAAGKDTQAALLLRHYKLWPVESGKYWRRVAKRHDKVGELLRRTFAVGHPTPVALMKKFIVHQLNKAPKNTDLLFIGNPRLKPEAQLLVKMLKAKKRNFYCISINLPESEIKQRSLNRRRDDQDWKYIDNRIKMYRLQVSKTIKYFKSLNKLSVVKGKQPIRKVAQDIDRIIDDYQRQQAIRGS